MVRLTLPTFLCPLSSHHLYASFPLLRLHFTLSLYTIPFTKNTHSNLQLIHMDVYGGISVDDLLDLPSDEIFSSSSSNTAGAAVLHHHHQSSATNYVDQAYFPSDFTDILSVPPDDAVELEWVSKYMDDSFTDFPAANELTAAAASSRSRNGAGHGRARSKRSRPAVENPVSSGGGGARRGENFASYGGGGTAAENGEVPRRCTHCASEKTPQWRTGPLGPKTLCNACGVRYKSGRLVPEYRPAASPTFVLTQHSNSHRKVLELRRQKDMLRGQHQQELQQQEGYGGGRHIPGIVTSPVHVSPSHLWKVKSEYV